jgi:hypothetical protein
MLRGVDSEVGLDRNAHIACLASVSLRTLGRLPESFESVALSKK